MSFLFSAEKETVPHVI